jgi:hypothetical protein
MAAPTFTPDRQRFRAVLAEMAEKAKTKLPESNGRVDKAVALVLAGDIAYDPATSTALVNSCTDATAVYRVRGKVCECQDSQRAPQHLCKHVLGVMFLIRVQQVLDNETTQEPNIAESAMLPEAQASCNVRLMVGPHEVQWTLRGQDEAEVFARLQALLARKDVKPLPPKPAPRSQGQWKQQQYQGRS